MRDNGAVPENVNADQTPEPAETPRAPLPGEPGFKAPLTKGQLNRMNQTVKGMIISVLLTAAVALPVIFLNPGSTKETYRDRLDVDEVAQQTITTQDFKAVSPDFEKGWYANKAKWNHGAADGVPFWELGIVEGDDHYVRMLQAKKSNASWVALATDGSVPTGKSVDVDGTAWQQRSQPGREDKKSILTLNRDGYTYILIGDHDEDEFMQDAAELVQKSAKDTKPTT